MLPLLSHNLKLCKDPRHRHGDLWCLPINTSIYKLRTPPPPRESRAQKNLSAPKKFGFGPPGALTEQRGGGLLAVRGPHREETAGVLAEVPGHEPRRSIAPYVGPSGVRACCLAPGLRPLPGQHLFVGHFGRKGRASGFLGERHRRLSKELVAVAS